MTVSNNLCTNNLSTEELKAKLEQALSCLGDMLQMLNNLALDEKTQLHIEAEAFYNAEFPDAQIKPDGSCIQRIVTIQDQDELIITTYLMPAKKLQ